MCFCALPLTVYASPALELRVTGRIVPDACFPSFTGGDMVDYREVPASKLTTGSSTLLSRKSVGVSVSCGMPTSLGIRLLDNRTAVPPASGMVKTSLRPSAVRDERYFGLKDDQGTSMGGYVLRFDTGKDLASPTLELSAEDGSWRSRKDGMLLKDTLYTWSTNGHAPARMQQMDATLSVQPIIESTVGALTDDVPLEGSTTLELVYF